MSGASSGEVETVGVGDEDLVLEFGRRQPTFELYAEHGGCRRRVLTGMGPVGCPQQSIGHPGIVDVAGGLQTRPRVMVSGNRVDR